MNETLPVWGWISGWGICPEVFAEWAGGVWPGYEHVVLAPREGAVAELRELDGCARVGGYSLGALLLLSEGADLLGEETLLLAPFFGFSAEANLGGRVERKSLLRLQKLFRRNARWGLVSFYDFAGLEFSVDEDLPYAEDDLVWGLEVLLERLVDLESLAKVEGVVCAFGDGDALIEDKRLGAVCEEVGFAVKVLAGAGHDFRGLGASG